MYIYCHFTLQALDEARSIARRPMAQSLKDEREEIVVRCYLAKGDADRAVAETAGHANPGKLVEWFEWKWKDCMSVQGGMGYCITSASCLWREPWIMAIRNR